MILNSLLSKTVTTGTRQQGLVIEEVVIYARRCRLDAVSSLKGKCVRLRRCWMRLTVSSGRAEPAGGGEEEAQSCPEPRRPHGTSNIHRSEEERAAVAAALLPALHVCGEAAAAAAAAAAVQD